MALARALIRRPKVLLLDEPLSALDKKLREQTQFELMNIQYAGGHHLRVRHARPGRGDGLSTRIAVMNRGQVVQVGTPSEIYEFPQNRFVADFIGTTNLFEGTVSGSEPGHVIVRSAEAGCDLIVDELGRFGSGQRVWVALRPEKIRLSKEPVARQPRQPDQGHGLGARLSGQPLDLPNQDGDRKDRDRVRAERSPHLGVVHRLERRGVPELDRELRGGSASMRARALAWRTSGAAHLRRLVARVSRLLSSSPAAPVAWRRQDPERRAHRERRPALAGSIHRAEEDLLNDKEGGSWLSDADLRKRLLAR